ncbi:hypothetical protein HELRODRAFT_172418 [Helobdella robusta]|uniref:Endonuclease/exonuclease/phosphatase domain-containing protein n=1 Tax=Helobdella robusta TaxID=6412 RepID=T1F5A8_HELRO|nr:hypothetical protein HELRODRAFT_172418 [Helobdella robusta]ESO04742.1 hypothetical protein HELRODRAFT_172418 [Helobdella robusta]
MITNVNRKSGDREKDDNNCQASLNATTDQARINAWEQLGQLIDGLLEFVKPKSNVHKEIKTKITKIANAFLKVKALETGKEAKQPLSQLPETQFLPLEIRTRNIEELSAIDTGADADSEFAVDILPRPVKRKDRTPPKTGTKKRREEVQTTLPSPTMSKDEEHSNTETETGWQRVKVNLNHCEAAHDLLMQTVRELKVNLAIVSEPYKHLNTQPWEMDRTAGAAIWSCSKLPFQNVINTEACFVATKVEDIYFYSFYAPPSLSFDEYVNFLDRLTQSAKQYFPVAIAGDFNAWAVDWGSKKNQCKRERATRSYGNIRCSPVE